KTPWKKSSRLNTRRAESGCASTRRSSAPAEAISGSATTRCASWHSRKTKHAGRKPARKRRRNEPGIPDPRRHAPARDEALRSGPRDGHRLHPEELRGGAAHRGRHDRGEGRPQAGRDDSGGGAASDAVAREPHAGPLPKEPSRLEEDLRRSP